MTWFGVIHVVAAVIALLTGATIFFRPKGTVNHRWMGYIYLVSMIFVNGAALSIYEDSQGAFGVFHYLAVVSLATLIAGFSFIRLAHRRTSRIAVHAHLMSWSYAGLLGAGGGQAAAAVGLNVLLVVAIILACAGAIIHTRVIGAVRRSI